MGTNLTRVKKAQTASQCCLRFLHCVVGGWLETWEWKLDARWPIFMKPTCWMHQRQLLPISLKTNSCERGRGEVGSTPWQDWPFSNSDPQIHFEQHVSLQNEWKHGQRETPPIFWNAYVWYVADCSVDAIVLVCAMYNCLMYRQIDVYIYMHTDLQNVCVFHGLLNGFALLSAHIQAYSYSSFQCSSPCWDIHGQWPLHFQ